MENFWDFSVWGTFNVIGVLLVSMLVANSLKRLIKPLRESLIPSSVMGGLLLLIIAAVYNVITDQLLFDLPIFGGRGMTTLEIITYH